MLVSDIMTPTPLTLEPSASLADARELMYEKRIRHIPIVQDQSLLGLISQRDVLAAEHSSLLNIEPEKRLDNEKSVRVSEFMKINLVTIDPHASIRQAALYIQKHKLGCLPVVENDVLVGIITDSDFVNVAINLLELAEEQDAATEDW